VTSRPEKSEGTLTVVIPAYNAEATIRDCLNALHRSHRRPDEIIIFDDGSADSTAKIARSAGATVIRKGPARQGPARGRNIGADVARGSIIVFVDADVAVHPDALEQLEIPLLLGKAVASFGSYDDRPKSRRLAALYANLRHHWVHQHGRSTAFTFWSGLGAIRTDTFRSLNGFDERFTEPSIEDIDLGIRILEEGGQIRLVKEALGTHHKDWGLLQLWKTDIFRRAVPWAQLIKQGLGRADDLNISTAERTCAIAAHLVLLAALATMLRSAWWPGLALSVVAYLSLNARFVAFLFRSGGLRAGAAGTILHWCYHVYASATFAVVTAFFPSPRTRNRIMAATAGRTHATRP